LNVDSVQIRKIQPPDLRLPNDTCLTMGDSISAASANGYTYRWSNGSQHPGTRMSYSGLHHVSAFHAAKNCLSNDSILVALYGMNSQLQIDTLRQCLKHNLLAIQAGQIFELPGDALKDSRWMRGSDTLAYGTKLVYRSNAAGGEVLQFLAQSQRGCRDTIAYNFQVYAHPKADFTPRDTLFCQQSAPHIFVFPVK
jgi:hypothetical protein